ncbi:MAG: arginine deiminase-related protein, partial [Candidatus Woesearchaeota archaeon]|nr:arginine deiminase-related protein [Candidatus Woesearchaeota archaeon]
MSSFLMCEPAYFALTEPINPWMGSQGKLDLQKAYAQWANAKQLLEKAGAKITVISAQPGLQDMTFCADAGIVNDNKVLLANYKYPARKSEAQHFKKWFAEKGYEINTSQELFEGGDVVCTDNIAVCGTGIRSSAYINSVL